jgi:hypothetical protein
MSLFLKGTGFSPYRNKAKSLRPLGPEGVPLGLSAI